MICRLIGFTLSCLVLLSSGNLTAQDKAENTAKNDKQESEVVEFAESFDRRYAKRKPLVGDSLSELVAFDELGNKLNFESLKGKYTVLNFGCLT